MVLGYGTGIGLGTNIISIVIAVILIASLLLPRKAHYFFNGIVLMLMGLLPILYDSGYIGFDIRQLAIVQYVILFIIVIAGRELIKEGIHEENKVLKYSSVLLGIVVITLTTLPALQSMGAIGFTIPQYPDIINSVLYILSGIFLIMGIFTLLKNS